MARMQQLRPLVIVLDGEIGAGKTTLLELLSSELRRHGKAVATVKEPVEKWKSLGTLQDFYAAEGASAAHTAYAFQNYALTTRVAESFETAQASPQAEFVLMERSLYTDRHVFAEMLREQLGPRDFTIYATLWELLEPQHPYRPSHFLYLKPSLEACMARVTCRARAGEVAAPAKKAARGGGVTAPYQRRLRAAHESYFQGPRAPVPGSQVHVLEGRLADDDFAHDPAAAQRITQEVFGHLGLAYCPPP